MRLLIATPLFPPDIGGPATYSKILYDELPKRGIAVDVLSFGEVRHLSKLLSHLIYFIKVLRYGLRSDIIFAQDPVSVGFPAAIAALLLRKKFVLKIVGDYAWEQGIQRFGVEDLLDEFLKKKYGIFIESLRAIQRFSAKRANAVIVPSLYLKSVIERWGISSDRILVIYNDAKIQKMPLSKQEARYKLGIPKNELVFFSAGRLVPWKGFEMLIDVMRSIIARHNNVKLFIAGDGPLYRALQERIYAGGLENNVILLGAISKTALTSYVRAMDMFLLNTAYEGFSHQLIEAFALGAFVITTDAGGNKELVQNGRNALIAPYNDAKAWRDIIEKAIVDDKLRVSVSCEAVLSAEKFSKGAMVNSLINLLTKQI